MRELGLRQEDLITVFGVTTRGAIGHYLSGRRQPSPAQLVALSEHLDCSLDWLMKGVNSEPAQNNNGEIEQVAASVLAAVERLSIILTQQPKYRPTVGKHLKVSTPHKGASGFNPIKNKA